VNSVNSGDGHYLNGRLARGCGLTLRRRGLQRALELPERQHSLPARPISARTPKAVKVKSTGSTQNSQVDPAV
jgi:hypothetical protein